MTRHAQDWAQRVQQVKSCDQEKPMQGDLNFPHRSFAHFLATCRQERQISICFELLSGDAGQASRQATPQSTLTNVRQRCQVNGRKKEINKGKWYAESKVALRISALGVWSRTSFGALAATLGRSKPTWRNIGTARVRCSPPKAASARTLDK